jgi:hypothetical protein
MERIDQKDVDWESPDAKSTAIYLLTTAFRTDPMMQLFDDGARLRLAVFVVEKLISDEAHKSMYVAANYVTYTMLPNSPYGAFGHPLAYHVGGLVQKSLYAESYREYFDG